MATFRSGERVERQTQRARGRSLLKRRKQAKLDRARGEGRSGGPGCEGTIETGIQKKTVSPVDIWGEHSRWGEQEGQSPEAEMFSAGRGASIHLWVQGIRITGWGEDGGGVQPPNLPSHTTNRDSGEPSVGGEPLPDAQIPLLMGKVTWQRTEDPHSWE